MADTIVAFGPVSLGTSGTLLYPVPAAKQAIVTELHVVNATTNSYLLTIYVDTDDDEHRQYKLQPIYPPPMPPFEERRALVLAAAQELYGYSNSADRLVISGTIVVSDV